MEWNAFSNYLHQIKEVYVFARVCLSVCLTVSKITQKRVREFGWNFACRQTSGRTDLLLSSIRIIVRMPEPDCFLRYRISAATRNYITSGKSHVYVLAAVAAARRGFKMVLFTASRVNTFVGGTCALYQVLLRFLLIFSGEDHHVQYIYASAMQCSGRNFGI